MVNHKGSKYDQLRNNLYLPMIKIINTNLQKMDQLTRQLNRTITTQAFKDTLYFTQSNGQPFDKRITFFGQLTFDFLYDR